MDLELQETEASVGDYSLDVLATDRDQNRPVIIENQLEATNHAHLGQLLTYAAGYDANVIVWLTREFRDEHRAALDWLNQRTGDETQFFGVVPRAISDWRISFRTIFQIGFLRPTSGAREPVATLLANHLNVRNYAELSTRES